MSSYTETWPANVTRTIELRTQRGPVYKAPIKSFSDEVNAFLRSGWRILNTYVIDHGESRKAEECFCVLGWAGEGEPKYPAGYEQ